MYSPDNQSLITDWKKKQKNGHISRSYIVEGNKICTNNLESY